MTCDNPAPLGAYGVWSGQLRRADPSEIVDASAELDELGFGTLWIPGGRGGDVFESAERLLRATRRCTVATGAVNIWMHAAAETARSASSMWRDHPGRFVLGLGVGHAQSVREDGHDYRQPLATMSSYLDELDAELPDCAPTRMLAALGPRMLELARQRTAGSHPYFVTPEHTAAARAVLGPAALLAPEQMVVFETKPERVRALARQHMARFLALPNYTRNLLRIGFEEADLLDGGSTRLVDAIVAWGEEAEVRARLDAHLAAGADHVSVQVLLDKAELPRGEWRRLGAMLFG